VQLLFQYWTCNFFCGVGLCNFVVIISTFPALSIFFLVVILSEENSIVRLNGKNYTSWEFQFRMFVKDKELWGHLDGSSSAPTDSKELSS